MENNQGHSRENQRKYSKVSDKVAEIFCIPIIFNFIEHVLKYTQHFLRFGGFQQRLIPLISYGPLSRNIGMGIKEIAARVDLINREKAAVEAVIAQYAKA